MPLPTNRGFVPLRKSSAVAPLPARVQADDFGTRASASTSSGRPPPPRPALTSLPAQGREVFTAEGMTPQATARALNALQAKIAVSTAQARANSFANGQLFQNVLLSGTLASGPSASRPPRTGLPEGFLYFDQTVSAPRWLRGGNWVNSSGTTIAPASSGELSTTEIDHGFGSPAVGVLITNVKNAVIHTAPRLVLYDDEKNNDVARIWFSYTPLSASPTADFYLYR